MSAAFSGWEVPSDERLPEGVAELAKIIGETEAVKPSWVRRLVLFGAEWRLTVSDCSQLQDGSAPWTQPNSLLRMPAAFPLQEAVDLLASPRNPEAELARREQQTREYYERLAREEAAKQKREKELREAKEQAERDRVEFKWDKWAKLEAWQQFAHLLAMKIERPYSDIAAALHQIALTPSSLQGQDSKLPPPTSRWWGGSEPLG